MIRESSDMGTTSDDDELDDWSKNDMKFVNIMKVSNNEVDQRLL